MFMELVAEANGLVQSTYCSITRLAFDGGFWQVCPELGGFVWRDTDIQTQFPFLRDFLIQNNVIVRNFSLSTGPWYIAGGGYFSYVTNIDFKLVIWFVPNLWQDSFTSLQKSRMYLDSSFWFGRSQSRYGCPYSAVSYDFCDENLLEVLPQCMELYLV